MKTILLLAVLVTAVYIGVGCLKSFSHSSAAQRTALAEVVAES